MIDSANISSLSDDEKFQLLNALLDYKKFNKLDFFEPYDYQLRFYEAGSHYKQRYLRAGNRTGKTYGAGMEFAQHLTGDYKDWFKGERINKSGYTYWCIGIDLDSVSKVLQKELLGTDDIRNNDKIGTGAIPRDSIELNIGMIKDGPRLRSCLIKHVDGGHNTLMFYGSNTEASVMGQSVKGVWMDEEPEHNSMALYAQCITRTATTSGFIMLTATPEAGMTELNKHFDQNEHGNLYLQSVGWDDCPHLTPEIQAELLSGIPEYQHEMRKNGIPFIGSGAVFPFKEEDITYSVLDYNDPSLVINAGIDFGQVVDPSVIIFSMFDQSTGIYYIDDEIYLNQSYEARQPDNIANEILCSKYPNVEIMIPHDGGINSESPQSKAKIMQEYGVYNMHQAKNPTELVKGSQSSMNIIAGLDKMALMFREGTLKINKRCSRLLAEIKGYYYQTPKNGGPVKAYGSNGDHCIDAARYSVMGLLRNIHTPLYVASNPSANRWSEPVEPMRNKPVESWKSNSDFYERDNIWS